jgi:uncharacterized protein (TIGR02246 family)
MKHLLSLALAAVLSAGPAFAQSPEVTSTDGKSAIHDELRTLNAGITKAMNENNVDGILSFVHSNVVFTTMNGDVARGHQAIRDYYAKMMTGPNKIVEKVTVNFLADDLTILYQSDTMGVCYGKTQDNYVLTDGTKLDISARWTGTLVKENGKWLVAAFHYSTNMFDNPVLDRLKRLLAGIGVGGTFIGLILGVMIGRKTVKR